MIYFIGAGPGDPELLTLKAYKLIEKARNIIYAGSLVNKAVLDYAPADCRIADSSQMNLDEIIDFFKGCAARNEDCLRLHTGEPSIYGAVREQMRRLDREQIAYKCIPGISSFQAAAAEIGAEYTLPDVSQTLIICRRAGRTPVPEGESIAELAAHHASMAIFLSSTMMPELSKELIEAYGSSEIPAAVVYRASWPDQKVIFSNLAEFPAKAAAEGIKSQALVLVGEFLRGLNPDRAAGLVRDDQFFSDSKLYAADFSHEFRDAVDGKDH